MKKKHISAYKTTALNPNRITKKKKPERVSAYSTAETNRGGLLEGIGYVAGRLGLGIAGVGEGLGDIVSAGGDLLRGDTEMAKYRFLDNRTAEAQQSLTDWYNPGKGMQFAGDVASAVGQSSVFLLDALVPGLGTGMFFTGTTGQSIAGAAQQTGDVGWKEIGYGIASGAKEAVLGKLVGAGGKVAGKLGSSLTRSTGKAIGQRGVTTALTKATGKKLASMGWNVAKNTLADAAGEFTEEFAGEYIDTGLQRLFGIDPNASTSFGEALHAGAVGFVSGAAMGAPVNVYNYKNSVAAGRAIREEGGVDQLLYRAAATVDVLKEQEAQAREKGRTKATVAEDAGLVGKTAAKGKQAVANLGAKITASKTKGYWTKLEKNINAYMGMDEAMRNSDVGDALLGELRGNLFFTNMSYAVEEAEEVLQTATDEEIAEWLVEVNEKAKKAGKADANYTVEDFRANKDGILSTVAAALWIDEIRRTANGTKTAETAPESPAEAPTSPWDGMTDNEDMSGYKAAGDAENALLRAAVNENVPRGSVQAMLDEYRKGTDLTPEEFAEGWSDGVHLIGRYGLKVDETAESAYNRLPQSAREAATRIGKETADTERKTAEEKAKAKKKPAAQAGKKGTVVRGEGLNVQKLSDEQYAAYKGAEVLAEVLGTEIVIETAITDKKGRTVNGKNGKYDTKTNRIHININALRNGKNIALYTLGHEVTHYIKEWSPRKFEMLADFVIEQLGVDAETAIADKLASLKRLDIVTDTMTVAEANALAREELVAEGMELVLTDGKVLEQLAKTDKTLWEKIRDWFFDIIGQIRRSWQDLNQASKTAKVLKETVDSLDEIERLFTEGVTEAGERTRTAADRIDMDPEQRKNTRPDIDREDVVFAENSADIRYSIDDTPETPDVSDSAAETNVGSKTVEELEAENKRLTEKVQRMSFERFRRAVKDGEIAAKEQRQALSRGADAVLESIGVHDGRNRRELLRRMSETYAHMAAEKGITYEEAFEESGEIAKWLISRQPLVRDAAMVEQAKETINTLRGTKIRLRYAQKMEVANTLGSSDEYRKAMFGRITVSDKDGVPLDVQWTEWADQYPDLFDKDTPEADMPERLREIYDSLADMRDRVETVDEYIDETTLTATIFSQIGQIGYGAEAAPFNDRAILADMLSGAAVSEHEYKIIKDYKAASDELAANDRRLAELRRETAELNREIKVLQDKLRGVDKTKREPWVMTALTDAIKRKGELMDEMDALAAKIKKADDRFFSLRAAAPVRRTMNELNKKIKAEEKRAERAETKAEQTKEWAKETVKKARKESEEKVKKARQEAQDYKAAVYKTSMDKVYKARREATDYKRAVYRTAYAKADEKNQKYRDKLDEMAKQSMERREITSRMRAARRVLGYLNTMLYHPTKQKHVPESLQALVDKTLRSADPKQFGVNRDHIREMSELAGKIRKMESKAGRTTEEQKTLDAMKTKYEKLEADTISVKRQAEALMTAFEQYVTSTADGDQIDKNMLEGLRQTVTEIEEAPLNEMTLKSLQAVEKIYTVIYHQVNTANQAFATQKAASIDQMSTKANTQVKEAKDMKFLSPRAGEWAGLSRARSYLWKNMKPLTVFEAIGSDELMSIFKRVLDGEDVWITDILEAKKALDEAKKKFGYNKWNLQERREVTTADGSKVSLTIGEMMSLYAYNFREQAEEHLSVGGFVLSGDAKSIESFKGDIVKYTTHVNDLTPHRMRKEDISKMSEMLTEEQRAYAKTVQEYLTSLGKKGNEVSRKLYGIDLFKETAYFPIKSSHDYIETQTGKSGDPNIKSRGTFKETVPKAGNPIVLEDFMEVVGDHVNTMATYHAFVLPVEDLTRVWNYTPVNIKRDADGKAILDENGMPVADTEGEAGYNSLKAEITKKYGKEANDYILQLLRDLNGGARRESAASILDKGLTAFKRSATMLSLSTIVQQPTSILRAMAYVDGRHFKGASFVPWETVKKYAPVAAIKEMGGHDTSTGARTADYINSKEYENQKDKLKAAALGILPESYGGDKQARDEYFGWLTGKADEVSWRYLFGAIVNEQAEKLGKAKDSEEVLKAAGERFAEVVRRTQVYDSTLTRSENMRSKDGLMKMATAFGAEPTTVVSMVVDAIIKAERGDKTFLRKSAAGIAFSIIANAAVASLIYAMRDDDEDETIPEKYVQSLTSELIEGFNPLEYLPIARDIMSMFKGYEIERSDMALVGNLMEQVELITSSKRSVPDKIFGVTGAVSAFFGLPVTNVYRDLKGLWKTGQSFTNAEEQTGAGLGHAMGDAVRGQFNLFSKLFGAESGNAYELYTAYVRGDTAHYERVKARYKTPQAAEMALRTELRDNDKRISKAAEARLSGDLAVYESLVDQIESEGIFDRGIVIRAINNEMLDLKDEDTSKLVPKDETVEDEDETAESLYKASDLNNALERGDTKDFAAILAALVEDKVSTGKTEAQAKASVKSSITAHWKKLYIEAWSRGDTEERKRIIAILTDTGLYGSRNDVALTVERWVRETNK